MRTIAATNVVLNTYTTLGAPASAGATSLTVSSVNALASMSFASMSLTAGDLVLVYEGQGATIATADSIGYGAITALGNAGRWEFVRVGAVNAGANTITLDAREHPTGLARSYGTRAQVVRVPQFSRLQVSASGSVIPAAWNGTVGGIVAVVSSSALTVVGRVDASGAGFRGGALDNMSAAPNGTVVTFRSADSIAGGEKGESIAGAASTLADGRYGRGAPANGGGGGNAHNAGGGGGANGGASTAAMHLGAGVMSATVPGATAWNIDPDFVANGNMLTVGPGGGRGGYSFGANDENALLVAPGAVAWGGDLRRAVGGRGGRPLGIALDRLFFGGGGGAGDANNNVGGAGGAGGGLVFLVARTIDGNGTIASNGAAGESTSFAGNDAAGGGGAGGTIVLSSVAPITSALTVQASGGVGGSQMISANESEGPGGGGGGGVVHVPATSTVAPVVAGAPGGTSTSAGITEFPANGATGGASGSLSSSLISCATFTGICPLDTTTFVTVTSPVAGAALATRAPVVTGTAEPGASVVVTVNATMVTVTADASGNWTATLPASAITTDGAVTINVVATDSSMNTASATVMVTVDTVAPSVAITAPTAMALLNTGAPVIRGTSEPLATVTLELGGGRVAMVMADATGAWSFAVPMGMPLADGAVTVRAVARDRAGNTSPPAMVTFTVDTMTTVAITAPATGSTVGTRTPTVQGTAEPNATVTLTVNGMSVTTTANAMGVWTVTVPAGAITMDGSVTLSVTARDAAGNTATATSTVTIDARVVVAITAPTNGATVNTRTPTVTGTALPGLAVALDFGGGRTAMVTADAMGNWTYTIPAGMELADGAMVTVTASASSGGATRMVSVTFNIDASTTLRVITPAAESRVTETRPTVSGTGEPGATVTLVFASGERATVTVDAMGNWSFTPTMPLPEGRNDVQIIAQDRAGNTAMATHVFIVVVPTDASVDATDASVDAMDDVADATIIAPDVANDGARDDVRDGSTMDSAADAQVPIGRLAGDGACDCRVVGAGRSGGTSPLVALVACAMTVACASRRRRAKRSGEA